MTEIIYLNSILSLAFLSLNSYILYRIIKLLKPEPKVAKPKPKKTLASAKNNVALNASVDFQKIQTAEITIPVIAEDVLTYGPGELGAAYPDTTNLYYPESAISDKEYLDTIVRSALQVQTHEKNTSEYNRDVDGWPLESWYDQNEKRAMLKGILHGEANVKYARENLSKPGFGTSAFISFLKIRKQKGTAPNGKPYDAIAEKLVNNHVAILPNIRDPKNVIVALNAVAVEDDEKPANKEIVNTNEEDKPMTQDEFNAYMDKYNARNKEHEELKNTVKNEILEELKKEAGEKKAETSNEKESEKTEITIDKKEDEAANTDKEDKDDAEAANALPSEEMLKDFSDHLGIKFPKAPTLKSLGKLVGIEAKNSFELITALNAKRKEITSSPDAKNSKESKGSLDDFLNKI